MAETAIEWATHVWNPTTGCDRVSPGCDHCYALTLAKRLKGMGSAKYQRDGDPRTSGPGFGLTTHAGALGDPLTWRKPRKVFVNSMSDLFRKDVPDAFIAEVFSVMARTPQHTYQILTKGRRYFGAAVGIAGTRRDPHDLAAGFFGGSVRIYYPKDDRAHHRPQYQWQRYGRSAVPVISAVLPYLRVKAEQARLALQLQESVDEARVMRSHEDPFPWFGPDYDPTDGLADLADEVRALNIRGQAKAGRELDGRTWDEYPQAVTS